jgi:hypothetical protein
MAKIIGIVLFVAIGAAFLGLFASHYTSSNIHLPLTRISTFNSSSSGAKGPIISSTITNATASTSLTAPFHGWRRLVVDKYKFQVDYPDTGWSFFSGDNIADPTVPLGAPLYVANVYTVRLAGLGAHQDQENITIVIAVYNSSPRVSLSEELSNAINDLQSAPQGSIEDVLAKAYEGGSGVLSYEATTTSDSTAIARLGAVVDGGGRLSYTTFLKRPGSNFIYAVELQLEFDKQQDDSKYVQIYKQLLSSFVFIN